MLYENTCTHAYIQGQAKHGIRHSTNKSNMHEYAHTHTQNQRKSESTDSSDMLKVNTQTDIHKHTYTNTHTELKHVIARTKLISYENTTCKRRIHTCVWLCEAGCVSE